MNLRISWRHGNEMAWLGTQHKLECEPLASVPRLGWLGSSRRAVLSGVELGIPKLVWPSPSTVHRIARQTFWEVQGISEIRSLTCIHNTTVTTLLRVVESLFYITTWISFSLYIVILPCWVSYRRKESTLEVFENEVLRKMFQLKRDQVTLLKGGLVICTDQIS
jgi:hypothetical protein